MNSKRLKKIIPILVAIAIAYYYSDNEARRNDTPLNGSPLTEQTSLVGGTQTRGSGVVSRILADDNDGSRHQRFILRLASGRTVLVAHNIDLASRVENIQIGDKIEFNGEFESNDRGGVIHWTHHDPAGLHEEGWLKHSGKTYQ